MTSCLMDASSAIHGWDEYPITEIKRNSPECHAWLKEANIVVVAPDDAIAQTVILLAGN